MRLINTTTGVLSEFFGKTIPPYAILSHTWEADELMYEEWISVINKEWPLQREHGPDPECIRSRAGYRKIVSACGIAKDSFSMEWLWVDTNCIDKRSSAELSEAINSMFQWYQKSKVCLVYLFDVPGDLRSDDEQLQVNGYRNRIILKEHLLKSRWFTRGWTLQELIAPCCNCVAFLSELWDEVGTMEELRSEISEITTIPQDLLVGIKTAADYSIATRMSWAASRATTRDEDMAYCLIGLFGINMPLLYGEGGTKAFLRLQEEIIKVSDDMSIFGWNFPPPPKNFQRDLSGDETSLPPVLRSCSVLSNSPASFTSVSTQLCATGQILFADVVAKNIYKRKKRHYTLTNSGVDIDITCIPVGGVAGYVFAKLNCYVEIKGWKEVYIPLRYNLRFQSWERAPYPPSPVVINRSERLETEFKELEVKSTVDLPMYLSRSPHPHPPLDSPAFEASSNRCTFWVMSAAFASGLKIWRLFPLDKKVTSMDFRLKISPEGWKLNARYRHFVGGVLAFSTRKHKTNYPKTIEDLIIGMTMSMDQTGGLDTQFLVYLAALVGTDNQPKRWYGEVVEADRILGPIDKPVDSIDEGMVDASFRRFCDRNERRMRSTKAERRWKRWKGNRFVRIYHSKIRYYQSETQRMSFNALEVVIHDKEAERQKEKELHLMRDGACQDRKDIEAVFGRSDSGSGSNDHESDDHSEAEDNNVGEYESSEDENGFWGLPNTTVSNASKFVVPIPGQLES